MNQDKLPNFVIVADDFTFKTEGLGMVKMYFGNNMDEAIAKGKVFLSEGSSGFTIFEKSKHFVLEAILTDVV